MNDNNPLDVHHVEVPVSDPRSVAQATEIATPVPEALVSAGPSVPTNTVEEKVVTETETPKSAKFEEDVKSHEVAQADKVTKSDEPTKDNNTKVAVKLATTPKIPSDSEDSNSKILSILAAFFAVVGSLALFGYVLVTGKIHLPKK